MFVKFGTNVSAKYPEVYNCETVYLFGTFPESINALFKQNSNNIHVFDTDNLDIGCRKLSTTIFYVQLPRYRNIYNESETLQEMYKNMVPVALTEDDHNIITAIYNEKNNEEEKKRINDAVMQRVRDYTSNKQVYQREIVNEANDELRRETIQELEDEISESTQLIPDELFAVINGNTATDGTTADTNHAATEQNNQSNDSSAHTDSLPIAELLSEITDPKTVYKKSISVTEYTTRVIEYVQKNKIPIKSFMLTNKADTVKCKLLLNACITGGKHNGAPCYHALITSCILIGPNNTVHKRLDLNAIEEFTINNYGPIEAKIRLTPKQAERYECNKSAKPGMNYNLFVHTLKKRTFKRRDYYDITVTPSDVKIPRYGKCVVSA